VPAAAFGADRDVRGGVEAIRRRGHDQILAEHAPFATDEVGRRRETGDG